MSVDLVGAQGSKHAAAHKVKVGTVEAFDAADCGLTELRRSKARSIIPHIYSSLCRTVLRGVTFVRRSFIPYVFKASRHVDSDPISRQPTKESVSSTLSAARRGHWWSDPDSP